MAADAATDQELQAARAEELLQSTEAAFLEVQSIELHYSPRVRRADYALGQDCGDLVLKIHLQLCERQWVCRPCAQRLDAQA